MNKVQHIIQGLYGIAESEKMLPNENARFTLRKTVECLEKALEEHDKKIHDAAIDKFAEWLYENFDGTYFGCKESIMLEWNDWHK